MYRFIATVICFLLSFMSVHAQEILLVNTGSLTGNVMFYVKETTKVLEQNNIKHSIKTTGDNCALSKLLWDKTNEPILFFTGNNSGNLEKNIDNCYIQPTNENLFYWILSSPFYFCSNGPDGKTLKDFTRPGSSHKIATDIMPEIDDIFEEIDKSLNIKTKLVKIGNNGTNISINMAKSKEVDFTFRSGKLVSSQTGGECFFSTKKTRTIKTPSVLWNTPDISFLSSDFFIMGKNFTSSQKNTVISLIQKAWSDKPWTELRMKREHDDDIVAYSSNDEYQEKINLLLKSLR